MVEFSEKVQVLRRIYGQRNNLDGNFDASESAKSELFDKSLSNSYAEPLMAESCLPDQFSSVKLLSLLGD